MLLTARYGFGSSVPVQVTAARAGSDAEMPRLRPPPRRTVPRPHFHAAAADRDQQRAALGRPRIARWESAPSVERKDVASRFPASACSCPRGRPEVSTGMETTFAPLPCRQTAGCATARCVGEGDQLSSVQPRFIDGVPAWRPVRERRSLLGRPASVPRRLFETETVESPPSGAASLPKKGDDHRSRQQTSRPFSNEP